MLKVVSGEMTVTAAATEYGYSRRHLHRLLGRYREGGLQALEPRSRRLKTTPNAASDAVREWVVELRLALIAGGLDAGPVTIAWHLQREGLHQAGLITPQPRKRPRSSYIRFEADQPNEMWQSDFMHWRLADGTDVEVLGWLDDHSRYLLSATVHQPASGEDVVATFLATADQHGIPACTLTDNGRVYTARFGGGRNAFEYLLPLLGVGQKNGSPGHPQTQGKIERFHQTLQRWLRARPLVITSAHLQRQLDEFREHYNEHRSHRALNRRTPGEAYRATLKAAPAGARAQQHYRLRYDRLDPKGKMSLRRAGKMHHLATGAANARKRVLAFSDDTHVTVINLTTGEILSVHLIQPEKTYWRNQNKEPGRWPGPSNCDL